MPSFVRLLSRVRRALRFAPVLISALPLAAFAQSTSVWYQAAASQYLTDAAPHVYRAPADTVTVTASSAKVQVSAGSASITLAAPSGASLAVGTFLNASRWPFNSNAPGIDMTVGSSGCNSESGWFTVLEYQLDSNFQLASFAADFEDHCDGAPAVYGEIRFNSTRPLTVDRPAGWTTPDPFAFIAQANLPPGTQVVSNAITVYGINAPAAIEVFGGEYSVNGGAFTSNSGTVSNRDSVRVRAASPASAGTSSTVLSIGGVAAAFQLSTYGAGDVLTGFDFQGGGYVFGGPELTGYPPTWAVKATVSGGVIQFDLTSGSLYYTVTFAPPPGGTLAVGAYEGAARTPFRGASPGLEVYGNGAGCNTVTGRFAVLDIAYNGDGTLARFAADFEHLCEGSDPPLWGEIRYNTAVPLTNLKPAGSTLADPFALGSNAPVRAGTVVTSPRISVLGVNAPVPVTISGGEYSVNGGPFTASAGTVSEHDRIVVRLTASRTAGATASALLSLGGQSASLSATTYAPGMVLTGLYYNSTAGDYIGLGQTRLYLVPPNELSATVTTTAAGFSMNTVGGDWWYLNMVPPGGSSFTLGAYEAAQRWPFQPSNLPGLDFSGSGRGCNQLAGRFVIRDLAFHTDGTLDRFAADFEQHCEITGPPLFGEIRYNSKVPFSALLDTAHARGKQLDLDGDGQGDVLWTSAGGGYGGWLMNGLNVSSYGTLFYDGSGVALRDVADFDGDGKSDLLGTMADGSVRVWLMDGLHGTAANTILAGGTGWSPYRIGDFNGDGKSDILWKRTDGSYGIWLMSGYAPSAYAAVLPAGNGYDITHVADFDGDGKADMLGTHTDGSTRLWIMDGTRGIAAATIMPAGSPWRPYLVRDFNGDGNADILWVSSDGQYRITLMAGGMKLADTILPSPAPGAIVAAAPDLDGDGKADLVWIHPDGTHRAWLMNGTTPTSNAVLLGSGTAWRVVGFRDFDGNGTDDLIWKNADGSYGIWLMNGTSATGYAGVLGPGTGFTMAP